MNNVLLFSGVAFCIGSALFSWFKLKTLQKKTMTLQLRWDVLSENLTDSVVIINPHHQIIYSNQGDVVGKNAYEFIPDAYHGPLREAFNSAQENLQPHIHEILTLQNTWYAMTIYPIIEKGQCISLMMVSRDITAQRQVQDALTVEKNRSAQYLNLANIIFVALNADGEVTLINQKGCELLGYSEAELRGKNWFDVCIPASIRPAIKKDFQTNFANSMANKAYYENPIVNKNGEIRVIGWHNAFVRDAAGIVTEFISAGEDITDYKEAEKQRFYQDKFQTLLITLATQFINMPSSEIDEAVKSALEEVGTFFAALRVSINLCSPDDLIFQCVYEWCENPTLALLPDEAVSPISSIANIYPRLRQGETLFFEDIEQISDDFMRERYRRFGVGSSVVVPMNHRGKIIGFLVIWNPIGMLIPSELTSALQVLSEIAVNAITRKMIEEETEQHRLELESLLEIGLAIDSTLPLNEILDIALMHLVRLIPCTSASIMLKQPEGLAFVSTWKMPSHIDIKSIEALLNQNDHWQKFYIGIQPTIIDDVRKDPLWVNIDDQEHLRSWMGVQLNHRGTFIGVINFDHALPNQYNTTHGDLAMSVASLLATTIVNHQTRADLENRVAQRTTQLQMEILIRQESEMREYQQRVFAEALLDTATVITSSLELDNVVEQILINIERVLQHDSTRIFIIEGDYANLIGYRGVVDGGEVDPRIHHIEIATSYYMPEIIETRLPRVMNDTHNDPQFVASISNSNWRSAISMPMLWEDRVIGFLNLGSKQVNFFQKLQIEHLRHFALQAAIAIQNARLYEQMQEVAVFEERQRLARELHDSVTQTLFSANSIAEALPHIFVKKPEKATDYMRELSDLTRSAMAEMRSLLVELRPESIIKTEIGVLINQLTESFTGTTGIPVNVVIADKFFLPEKMQVVFYRITQETFNNIAKHAHATQVTLRLNKIDSMIRLEIQDDGRGFDQTNVLIDHFGLKIMQERASHIGAELTIISEKDQGTLVILTGYLS